MIGVTLVDAADAFCEEDEVLYVLLCVVMLIFYLF